MRTRVCLAFLASMAVVTLICLGIGVERLSGTAPVWAAEDDGGKSDGPPPLVIDKDAPLLLDDPSRKEDDLRDPFGARTEPMADNLACFCCHRNYEEEPLAVVHAKNNIGCEKCHGESIKHRNDEDNVTPPDTIFPSEKIAKMCEKCHDEHDVPAIKVIARWREKCLEKTDVKDIVCTDCHGQHRLPIRTVRWDKQTKELIVRKPEKCEVDEDYPKNGKDPDDAASHPVPQSPL